MTTDRNSKTELYTKEAGWLPVNHPDVSDETKQDVLNSLTGNYRALLANLGELPEPRQETAIEQARRIAQNATQREHDRIAQSSADAYTTWVSNGRKPTYKERSDA
jgi:hypothetical protein